MAVGAECHASDTGGMIPEGQDLLPGLGVPDLDGPIAARRGDPPAIGAERHALGEIGVPDQRAYDAAAGRIDQLNIIANRLNLIANRRVFPGVGWDAFQDPPAVGACDGEVVEPTEGAKGGVGTRSRGRWDLLARVRVPEPRNDLGPRPQFVRGPSEGKVGPVQIRLRGDEAAVSAERGPGHPPGMPAVDDRTALQDVPDLDHALDAPGEDSPAVGVERHREHMAGVTMEVGQLTAVRHIPEPDAAVLAHRGEERTVATERDALGVPLVAVDDPGLFLRRRFP